MGPLERAARLRSGSADGTWSDGAFAHSVNVSERTVARWRAAGHQIRWSTCDASATALGLHPIHIWGEDWVNQDRGIIDGTDRVGLRALDRAMEIIGEKMAQDFLDA